MLQIHTHTHNKQAQIHFQMYKGIQFRFQFVRKWVNGRSKYRAACFYNNNFWVNGLNIRFLYIFWYCCLWKNETRREKKCKIVLWMIFSYEWAIKMDWKMFILWSLLFGWVLTWDKWCEVGEVSMYLLFFIWLRWHWV